MKFFVPGTATKNSQGVYEGFADSIKDQLKATITERRIFSIDYRQDKKNWRLQVGEVEPRERRYVVMAIFESKPYLIFARTTDGSQGITILIDHDDVTAIEDFDL